MKGKVTAAGRRGGGPDGPAEPGALSADVAKPVTAPGVDAAGCDSAMEKPGGPEGMSEVPPQLEDGRGVAPNGGPPSVDLARRLSIPRRKAKAVLDEGVDETDPALDLTEVLSPVGGGGAARRGRNLLGLRAGVPHAGLGRRQPSKAAPSQN